MTRDLTEDTLLIGKGGMGWGLAMGKGGEGVGLFFNRMARSAPCSSISFHYSCNFVWLCSTLQSTYRVYTDKDTVSFYLFIIFHIFI